MVGLWGFQAVLESGSGQYPPARIGAAQQRPGVVSPVAWREDAGRPPPGAATADDSYLLLPTGGPLKKLVPPVWRRNAGSETAPPWRVSEYAATRAPVVSMSIVK